MTPAWNGDLPLILPGIRISKNRTKIVSLCPSVSIFFMIVKVQK